MSGISGIARRVPLLFALLAVCVLGLLAMSWRAYAELQDEQAGREDTRVVLSELDHLERTIAPRPALVQCAAHGATSTDAPEPPDHAPIVERLRKHLQDDPAQQRALDELPVLIEVLRRAYIEPIVAACRGGRGLGVAGALDLAAVGVRHRDRVQQQIEALRAVELERLDVREARLQSRTEDADRLFMLFAVATVLLSVVATVGLRAFTARLADTNRRLRREATERGVAQEQLRESQRRLEMTLDHIPDGVIAFDAGTRVQWINPAAEAMFGRSRPGMRAQPVSLLIPELDERTEWPDTEPPEDAPAATPWRARRETMYGLRADGAEFPIEVALVQTRVGGERVGVCVCRDLSELERIERMKHEFVSMVSHELRTPLTSIRGSLSMLADGMAGELTGPVHRLVGLAHQNAERLVALVNDILDFEKLRAGEVRMELAPLDLGDAARAALESCEGYAHQHRVATRLQTGGPLPVLCDAQRLQQVLANLLSNAIKFSPDGGEVLVRVEASGGEPCLRVIDQGPGVPPAFVEQLFEPFAQASNLETRKRGGTGLGLAISRAMIEQMGGRIGLEPPQPGQGAVFWITLPTAPAVEQPLG